MTTKVGAPDSARVPRLCAFVILPLSFMFLLVVVSAFVVGVISRMRAEMRNHVSTRRGWQWRKRSATHTIYQHLTFRLPSLSPETLKGKKVIQGQRKWIHHHNSHKAVSNRWHTSAQTAAHKTISKPKKSSDVVNADIASCINNGRSVWSSFWPYKLSVLLYKLLLCFSPTHLGEYCGCCKE